jgi:hypothetical protein
MVKHLLECERCQYLHGQRLRINFFRSWGEEIPGSLKEFDEEFPTVGE